MEVNKYCILTSNISESENKREAKLAGAREGAVMENGPYPHPDRGAW